MLLDYLLEEVGLFEASFKHCVASSVGILITVYTGNLLLTVFNEGEF